VAWLYGTFRLADYSLPVSACGGVRETDPRERSEPLENTGKEVGARITEAHSGVKVVHREPTYFWLSSAAQLSQVLPPPPTKPTPGRSDATHGAGSIESK